MQGTGLHPCSLKVGAKTPWNMSIRELLRSEWVCGLVSVRLAADTASPILFLIYTFHNLEYVFPRHRFPKFEIQGFRELRSSGWLLIGPLWKTTLDATGKCG